MVLLPFLPPPPQRGGGEETPFENCAKERHLSTTNANMYTPFCTDVTSVIAPLAIEGCTDKDGEQKPAPVMVKIEGAERGKEEGTAPAATTMAPAQLACHAGGACCNCGLQSSCRTARCTFRRVGRNCMSCWCLVRCASVGPQTRQEEQRMKQSGRGRVEGQRRGKRRRGWGKGAPARARAEESGKAEHTKENGNGPRRRNVPSIPPRPGTGTRERRGDADTTGDTADGEGESGDVPGYIPNPEDLRLREVYGYWVHGNLGTHMDGGVADDRAWQGWWRDLAVMLSQRYEAPHRKVGRRFVNALVGELRGSVTGGGTRSDSSSFRR